MKRIALFGATGGVGRHVLDQALAAGHQVTAIVREPSKLDAVSDPDRGRRLQVVHLDLVAVDPDQVRGAIRGTDAVLSAVGASSRSSGGIAVTATAAIVGAMSAEDVRRLVVISAAPVSTLRRAGQPRPVDPGEDRLSRFVLNPLLRGLLADVYADLATMEDQLRAGDRDWTALRPPRLTDQPGRPYRTAIDQSLPRGRTISRSDVATEMLAVLDRPETIGHAVGIAD